MNQKALNKVIKDTYNKLLSVVVDEDIFFTNAQILCKIGDRKDERS